MANTGNIDRRAADHRLRELFFGQDGYSCAQVVLIVLREIYGIEPEACLSQGYALGGGIGHTGQGWCGGLVGGAMALGELYARRVQEPSEIAGATWPMVQGLYDDFVREFGHSDCSGLLGFSIRGGEGLAHYDHHAYKEDVCFPCLSFVVRKLLPLATASEKDDSAEGASTRPEGSHHD